MRQAITTLILGVVATLLAQQLIEAHEEASKGTF